MSRAYERRRAGEIYIKKRGNLFTYLDYVTEFMAAEKCDATAEEVDAEDVVNSSINVREVCLDQW